MVKKKKEKENKKKRKEKKKKKKVSREIIQLLFALVFQGNGPINQGNITRGNHNFLQGFKKEKWRRKKN